MKKTIGLLLLTVVLCACGHRISEPNASMTKSMQAAQEVLQKGDTAYAIDLYKQVITTIADSSTFLEIAPMAIDAMDKLINIEHLPDQKQKAITWFKELRKHPTLLIRSTCWRDLHTSLAELYFCIDSVAQAEENMSTALDLPMIGANADQRYFRDYVQASRIFIGNDSRRHEIVGWLEKALKHAEHCDSLQELSYARSMLGTMYFWQGRIGDAFVMMNDNLKDVEAKGDTMGIIMALNTLTNLHNMYRLNEIANSYASRAIALAQQADIRNNVTISDAYMLKIGAIGNIAPDSVSYYVVKAEDNCRNMPYNMGQEDIDFAAANHIIWWTNHDQSFPDSLKQKLRNEAETRLLRYVENVVPIKRAGAYTLLSRLYLNENPTKVEAMLDSAYRYQHLIDGIPMISKEATLFAISHYDKTGNTNKIVQYVHDLIDSEAIDKDKDTEQQLVENIIELRTAQAEAQVKQLELEVQLKHSHTIIIITIAIAAFFMLTVFFMIYWYKQKQNRERMNKEKDTLERQLSNEIERSKATEKELEGIVTDLDNRRTVEAITIDILKDRGETEFRNRFHTLYPKFNKNISERGVSLSRREEIMCMLIILGLNNQEISQIQNIERKSVNVARYRLRQKLNLPDNCNLDDFLRQCAQ